MRPTFDSVDENFSSIPELAPFAHYPPHSRTSCYSMGLFGLVLSHEMPKSGFARNCVRMSTELRDLLLSDTDASEIAALALRLRTELQTDWAGRYHQPVTRKLYTLMISALSNLVDDMLTFPKLS